MPNQSTNMPWVEGMNYGMGVNLLNGDIAGKAVDTGTIRRKRWMVGIWRTDQCASLSVVEADGF